jgi:hypothetical protein
MLRMNAACLYFCRRYKRRLMIASGCQLGHTMLGVCVLLLFLGLVARGRADEPRNRTAENLAHDLKYATHLHWNPNPVVLEPGRKYTNVYIHAVLLNNDLMTADILAEELELLKISQLWSRADHIFLGILGKSHQQLSNVVFASTSCSSSRSSFFLCSF